MYMKMIMNEILLILLNVNNNMKNVLIMVMPMSN